MMAVDEDTNNYYGISYDAGILGIVLHGYPSGAKWQ